MTILASAFLSQYTLKINVYTCVREISIEASESLLLDVQGSAAAVPHNLTDSCVERRWQLNRTKAHLTLAMYINISFGIDRKFD